MENWRVAVTGPLMVASMVPKPAAQKAYWMAEQLADQLVGYSVEMRVGSTE